MDKDIWSKWQGGDYPFHQMSVELGEVVRYSFGYSLVFDCTKVWLKIQVFLLQHFLRMSNPKLEDYLLLEWYHQCPH